jgi:hypothetical protein
MWCSTCQQDVTSTGSPAGSPLRCNRCEQTIAAAAPSAEDSAPKLDKLLRTSSLTEEDWTLEAELRGVQRLLGSLKSTGSQSPESKAIHESHSAPSGWHAANNLNERLAQGADAGHRREAVVGSHVDTTDALSSEQPKGNLAAWAILSLGLATFACGAVLLVWSLVAARDDLWPVGMPLALIGQAGLILGLILQLDGLWTNSRKTATALSHLDGELSRVRQATTLLSTSRTNPAQSFYVHLAEGAAPQMLLADLKGQLDLLAQHMSRQR